MGHDQLEARGTRLARRALAVALLFASVCTLAACPFGRGSKELGEECEHHNDCAGAWCEAKVCSAACRSDADCAPAKTPMKCVGNVKSKNNPEGYGACAVR